MGYHQQFRAVPPDELVAEPSWLADFMWSAWRRFQEEYAAGIAHCINKEFDFHARLYTGGSEVPNDESDARTLPVYGGDLVFQENEEPPFVVMTSEQVRRTADYLAEVDFDALWAVAGEKIRIMHWDQAADRAHRLGEHRELTGFYGRAATAGHVVVKAFWF